MTSDDRDDVRRRDKKSPFAAFRQLIRRAPDEGARPPPDLPAPVSVKLPHLSVPPPPAPAETDEDGTSVAATAAGERVGPPSARESVAKPVAEESERSSETSTRALTGAVATAPTLTPSVPPAGEVSALWSGKIRAREEVGRGAMGSVLRATDTKLRREIALKVTRIPRDKLPTDVLARFIEEAQITAQLEHPNVVPVHDLGLDPEGRAYFSMKLVRGRSLESILEQRRKGDATTLSEFGLRRLLDVFLQVCQAVDYAHARGVIHRDLKPSNIMVGDFGEVLVMDWGVAKLKGRPEHARGPAGYDVTSVRAGNQALATHFGAVVGTPVYMSPEQAKGLEVDERTDLWSLGVILYEILSGALPFDGKTAEQILVRVIADPVRAPSTIQKNTPLALETLVLRMLEKDPEQRTLSLPQIRSHVQDYIEGIGHSYRRDTVWTNAVWLIAAVGVFAFLVSYLTGQSVATVVALTPASAFNAVGWILLVVAVSYPLWSASVSLRVGRGEHDRFRPPASEEIFVSGFLAHRTRAAAIAPLFQLVFIVEILAVAITGASRGVRLAGDDIQRIVAQLRAEWAHALIMILLFLFAYLLLLSAEVRFARRVGRYVLLVRRARWETAWPLFLIVVLLTTVIGTNAVEWTLSNHARPWAFLREQMLTQRLDVFDIVKTLVFQGTFLLGLVVATVLAGFPFAEVLASLRIAYQPADDASVASRQHYFLRSMAMFQVAGAHWLYGGAMIASLTALTILSKGNPRPVVEQVLYILGPSLIGFIGFALTRRYATAHLAQAPAVRRMLHERVLVARQEQAVAKFEQLGSAAWARRLLQLAVPAGCVVAYLVWTGSGVREQALRQLMLPVSTKGWLLILPYAVLVPLLLVRDHVEHWLLRRHIEL